SHNSHCLHLSTLSLYFFSFFYDTPTSHIYTLSLHDALPIFSLVVVRHRPLGRGMNYTLMRCRSLFAEARDRLRRHLRISTGHARSEEHTSELQSRENLVCRLLLEKKKKKIKQ